MPTRRNCIRPARARPDRGSRRPWGGWGSLLGPYLVGVVLPNWGQGGVFTVGAGCFFVAALLVYVLGVETRGISLEELSARQPEPSARAVSVPRTR